MPSMAPVESDSTDLSRLHAEWQSLHGTLRVQEQVLSQALELYAKGKGPRPDTLMNEVSEMRAECAVRFNRLMAAVRGAPPSTAAR